MAAVLAVATLMIGSVATSLIGSATDAYASNKDNSKKVKIELANKCGVEHSSHVTQNDVNCQIQLSTTNCLKGSVCIVGKLEPLLLALPT
jgi:hypothetical protein